MIPSPAGSRSSRRQGNGLPMSKILNSTKAAARTIGDRAAGGTTKSASGMLATSSNTIDPGSFRPICRAARVQTGTPTAEIAATSAASTATEAAAPGAIRPASQPVARERGTPSAAPNVPGAKGTRPSPPAVAANTAGANQGVPAGAAGEVRDSPEVDMSVILPCGRLGMIRRRVAGDRPSTLPLRTFFALGLPDVVSAMEPAPVADPSAIGPLALVEYPHPALLRRASPVTRLDAGLREAVSRMFDIMYEAQGVGLAANQVALPYRLFIVNPAGRRGEGEERVFINPVLSRPRGTAVQEEGCLSLPGVRMDVRRPQKIVVDAFDLAGEPIRLDLDGLLSRIVQHEFDHLEGRLFIDRLPEAAALEVRSDLDVFREVFFGRQSRGEVPGNEAILADLDRLEAARC